MNIFSIFTLIGGLALFLYGMNILSSGLEKMAGSKLELFLKRAAKGKIRSLLLGMGITVIIQSSSAMTVMLVGFVNSGIMELGQTIGIIMGSNIGTTLTAWFLSITGIESNNLLVQFFKPTTLAPIMAGVGIFMIMTCSKSNKKYIIGSTFMGFAILIFGINFMSASMSPLAENEKFMGILVAFKNPLFGVLAGTIITGIIQSSAASIGILQALSLTGQVSYDIAILIIMGQNIGTCVTTVIASIGANKNAKRVAGIHIYFNIIGTCICLVLYYGIKACLNIHASSLPISPIGIAAVHSVFNITTTVILLPFSKGLEKLARLTIKDKINVGSDDVIDERVLKVPTVAIAKCKEGLGDMCKLVVNNLYTAEDNITKYNSKTVNKIIEDEERIDKYEDQLGTWMVKLSNKPLSDVDSREVSRILYIIGDIERIGDHAINLVKAGEELSEKELQFSYEAKKDLNKISVAVNEIVDITFNALKNEDVVAAKQVEPLRRVIAVMKNYIKEEHIKRLKIGVCTIEQGIIFNELLTSYVRIADHCSNIAIITVHHNEANFDTHLYMSEISDKAKAEFNDYYDYYSEKYNLNLLL